KFRFYGVHSTKPQEITAMVGSGGAAHVQMTCRKPSRRFYCGDICTIALLTFMDSIICYGSGTDRAPHGTRETMLSTSSATTFMTARITKPINRKWEYSPRHASIPTKQN